MRLVYVFLAMLVSLVPAVQAEEDQSATVEAILDGHILPGFARLNERSAALAEAAQADCRVSSVPLQEAYHSAFDAWVAVSHLRFGPTEQDNRAFALAFWPDTKGFTPKSLSRLIASQDPVIDTPEGYNTVSIAARGFYALEFMLYDPKISTAEPEAYHCALIRTMTADIAATASAIHADWDPGYADLMRNPGPGQGQVYKNQDEVLQELFKALNTGLQLASETRLGRPLGTYEHPRPNRAEARRSGRSLHQVSLSLLFLRQLAGLLSTSDPLVAAALDADFKKALKSAETLDDPVFAGVADPRERLRVEALQQAINDIRALSDGKLGPLLGVEAGFNSLDGD